MEGRWRIGRGSSQPGRQRPRHERSERIWLHAASAAIGGLVILQQPGRIVAETKLDLVLAPGPFLHRAVGAWDPSAAFGRVQNQAAGYLFPLGPGAWLLHLMRCPPWLVQRLLIAVLLMVGVRGAHRVAAAVGVASISGRVLAGLAYALSPASLTTVAFQSGGQLPYLLAPWVLVPLLEIDQRGDIRRASASSALAVAAMGGINGAATFAVLPLPLIWFASREPGPARRRLMGRWFLGTGAATLWWLTALAVTVRYGLRFTSLTEQAATTTATTAAFETWRGTGNWMARLVVDGRPWLPGAATLVSGRAALLAGAAGAAAGAAGLGRRDAPGRSWLLPAALLGACLMGIGHAGSAAGPFSDAAQALLDGPLVLFRNVHKFSPLVRLPLAIGLGHLVALTSADRPARPPATARPAVLAARARAVAPSALGALLLVVTVAPGAGRLTAPGGFARVPAYWYRAAAWLDRRPAAGRVLLLPAAPFGEYRWGRPLDEPLSSLLHRPWAVRDLIPIGGNGSTRLLDGVDAALTSDVPPPGLTEALHRSGIGHVLIRNDLDLDQTGAPPPVRVRAALARVSGLRRVAAFGPPVAAGSGPSRPAIRAVDIYRVGGGPPALATLDDLHDALAMTGGPESVLAAPPTVLAGRTSFVGPDAVAPGLPRRMTLLATDTARRRDVGFGDVRDTATLTLTRGEPSPRTGSPPRDRWADRVPPPLTTARLRGAASLTDTTPRGAEVQPEHTAPAAFDGDPDSWWAPPRPTAGHALVIGFTHARHLSRVTVVVHDSADGRITGIAVRTDRGAHASSSRGSGRFTLSAPAGPTRHLRVEITGVTGSATRQPPGIAEIRIGGAAVERTIVTAPGDHPADLVALTRLTRDRSDPLRTDEEAVLDRTIVLNGSREWMFAGTASTNGDRRREVGVANAPERRGTQPARCGGGPPLTIDDTAVATRLLPPAPHHRGGGATSRPWRVCRPIALASGEHHIVGPAATARITTLLGRRQRPEGGSNPAHQPSHRPMAIHHWGSQARSLRIGRGAAAVLTTTENHNPGWVAHLRGRRLRAVRVDGWRQGFLLPAGHGGVVTMRFEPDHVQARGLTIGAIALLALLVAAVAPSTRHPRRMPTGPGRSGPPPRGGSDPPPLLLAGAVGLILGGPLGLAALPLRALAAFRTWLPGLAAVLVVAAGVAATMEPAGAFSATAQTLAVLGWVTLASA